MNILEMCYDLFMMKIAIYQRLRQTGNAYIRSGKLNDIGYIVQNCKNTITLLLFKQIYMYIKYYFIDIKYILKQDILVVLHFLLIYDKIVRTILIWDMWKDESANEGFNKWLKSVPHIQQSRPQSKDTSDKPGGDITKPRLAIQSFSTQGFTG